MAATLETTKPSTKAGGCGPVRPSKTSKRRAVVLVLVHLAVLVHVAHWKINGTTLTPLEPSESMQTLELGYVNAGFLLFTGAILLTMVIGRFFCGWACHVVAYQDACAWILGKLKLRPKPVRSRLLVWVPIGAAFYMFAWPTVYRFTMNLAGADFPWPTWVLHLTTDDLWRTFPGPVVSILTLLWVGALAVWFLGAKGFCTYGCPYGAVFGIAEKVSPVRIRVTDACEGCGHCTAVCTSNVRVHEEVKLFKMVVDSGCMKCLDCVSVCPKDALYFGAGPIPSPSEVRHVRPERRWDYTWPEECALAVLFFAAFWSFRGLFHAVPFLFALAIGTTFAWLAMTAWRVMRGKGGSWNGWRLSEADGKPTRAGRNFTLIAVAAAGLTAQAGWLQWNLRDGLALKAQVAAAPAEAHSVPAWKSDLASARATLDRVAAWSWAPDAQLDVDRADLALLGGDLTGAETLFRKALAAGEDGPYVLARLGDVEAARGKTDAAEKAYNDALAAGSGDLSLWTKLADIAMSRGDTKTAAGYLEQFVKGNPAAMPIRDGLVTLYEMLGDKAAAEVHRRAIREAASRPTHK